MENIDTEIASLSNSDFVILHDSLTSEKRKLYLCN